MVVPIYENSDGFSCENHKESSLVSIPCEMLEGIIIRQSPSTRERTKPVSDSVRVGLTKYSADDKSNKVDTSSFFI